MKLAVLVLVGLGLGAPARADDSVVYDCSPYPAVARHARTHPAIAAVRGVVAHRWTSSKHHVDGMAEWVGSVIGALRVVGKTDLSTLSLDDRIVLQGLLYDLAHRLTRAESRWWTPADDLRVVARRAARLIRAVAPGKELLVAIGSEPSNELVRWIGPRATWVDRQTPADSFENGSGALFHEHKSKELVAFRLVRSGPRRSLIAQRVAFDRDGKAYVTPQISAIELRDGLGVDAPACIGHAHDGGLEAVAFADLSKAISDDVYGRVDFVHVTERGVGCRSCHANETSIGITDVADRARGAAIVEVRRKRVVARAESMLTAFSN